MATKDVCLFLRPRKRLNTKAMRQRPFSLEGKGDHHAAWKRVWSARTSLSHSPARI